MKGAAAIAWFDWLRFLAALQVLLAHVRGTAFVEFSALPHDEQSIWVAALFVLTRLGHEAVLAFFVLSGFLVGGRAIELVRLGTFSPADYAIDRCCRILLPLVPALVLTVAVALWRGRDVTAAQFVGNVLGLQGSFTESLPFNAPLWSLAYETWFYVLGGACATLAIRRGRSLSGLVLLLLAAGALVALGPWLLIGWLAGALAYLYRPSHPGRLALAALLVVIAASCLLQMSRGTAASHLYLSSAWSPWAAALFSIGFATLLSALRGIAPPRASFFGAGSALAAFSYSLYLTHYPVLSLCELWIAKSQALSVSGLVRAAVLFSLCMAVALLFYWLFERHTQTAKTSIKRLSARLWAPRAG